MLPHFFKQFLFWLCFCWRRRHQWHHRPPRCCDCVAAFFQTCFFCLSAGGRGHYATGLQGAVLPHFFKQFLFWLCFCWRRRHQWHQQLPRCCDCVAAFLLTCFFCLSAGGIKRCSSSMCIQGAVLVLLHWCSSTVLQTIYFVCLLEAPSMPSRPKVLCCCISSNMFFFGVSAGGVMRCSTTEKIQGAVLLHFFNEFFFCVSAGGIIKRCCRRQLRLRG